MCFVKCRLWESIMLQSTYFISVELMPGKYREGVVFNYNRSVWMNTLCHQGCTEVRWGPGKETSLATHFRFEPKFFWE